MADIYQVEILKSWPNPQGGTGHSIVTAIFLFDEEDNPRGMHWMTEEGRPRYIGTGQGKWSLLPSDKIVILWDEGGHLPIARLEYKQWPWRKGVLGKMSYYGPGTTKALDYDYRVVLVQ